MLVGIENKIVGEKGVPSAAEITLPETLALLDGPLNEVAEAVANGAYAFWLGSGISRDRVVGLDGVLEKLLEFLRRNAKANSDCPYKAALTHIIELAVPSDEERGQVNLGTPVSEWPCTRKLIQRLWKQYADVLSTEIATKPVDFLLWVGLDFPNTFAAEEPDVEHLVIAMLALEGAISEVATPNWDGLLEAALAKLGHADKVFKITVAGDDLRTPAAAQAILYKFHGCARRAIESEAKYRPLLVARSAQIVGWMTNDTFRIVRDQLTAVAQTSRAFLIGLSAQDVNIKNLFGAAGAHQGWKWNDNPTPIVISAEELAEDQKVLLSVAYGADFEPNRAAILESARVRAYAKPLLLGLLLYVLTAKLKVLLSDVNAPNLAPAAVQQLAQGLTFIRNKIAQVGDADRRALVQAIGVGLARVRHQLTDGISNAGMPSYYPIDSQSANLMKGKQALASTGQREAAAALGLIGLEAQAGLWQLEFEDPTSKHTGPFRLQSAHSRARIFLAANDDAISGLISAGAYSETDNDVVVICSKKVAPMQQRNPGGSFRDGSLTPTYISFGPMLSGASGLDDLRDAFRKRLSP